MTERAYRYRFYPTPEQEQLLRRTLGCVRLVYNKALHTRTSAWYERQERVGYKETWGMLTQWKKQEELQFQGRGEQCAVAAGIEKLTKSLYQLLGRAYRLPELQEEKKWR